MPEEEKKDDTQQEEEDIQQENEDTQQKKNEDKKEHKDKKRGEDKEKKNQWMPKIPPGVLFSPGGMILAVFSLIIEVIDILIPVPVLGDLIKIPLEIMNMIIFIVVTGFPLKSLIIPFLIERIPFIGDIIPTWFLRLII